MHVLLSPRGTDGKAYYITKRRLALFKERWERELGRVLERQERRRIGGLERGPSLVDRLAARSRGERLPSLPMATLARQLMQGRGGRAAVTLARSLGGAVGRAARLQREIELATTAPERLVRKHAFDLLLRFMPAPLRRTVGLARTISRIIPRG